MENTVLAQLIIEKIDRMLEHVSNMQKILAPYHRKTNQMPSPEHQARGSDSSMEPQSDLGSSIPMKSSRQESVMKASQVTEKSDRGRKLAWRRDQGQLEQQECLVDSSIFSTEETVKDSVETDVPRQNGLVKMLKDDVRKVMEVKMVADWDVMLGTGDEVVRAAGVVIKNKGVGLQLPLRWANLGWVESNGSNPTQIVLTSPVKTFSLLIKLVSSPTMSKPHFTGASNFAVGISATIIHRTSCSTSPERQPPYRQPFGSLMISFRPQPKPPDRECSDDMKEHVFPGGIAVFDLPEASFSRILFPYEEFVKFFRCEVFDLSLRCLVNCGNNCYLNAVLQCLIYTKPIVIYLLHRPHSRTRYWKDWCLMCKFEQLVMMLREGGGPLSPGRMLLHMQSINCQVGDGSQEDAQEFLRLLVASMQSICWKGRGGESMVEARLQETTFIQHTYGGQGVYRANVILPAAFTEKEGMAAQEVKANQQKKGTGLRLNDYPP